MVAREIFSRRLDALDGYFARRAAAGGWPPQSAASTVNAKSPRCVWPSSPAVRHFTV